MIGIKQKRKVKLPDAIIYATALNLKCDLITNNVSDFEGIGLQVRIIEAEIT